MDEKRKAHAEYERARLEKNREQAFRSLLAELMLLDNDEERVILLKRTCRLKKSAYEYYK